MKNRMLPPTAQSVNEIIMRHRTVMQVVTSFERKVVNKSRVAVWMPIKAGKRYQRLEDAGVFEGSDLAFLRAASSSTVGLRPHTTNLFVRY